MYKIIIQVEGVTKDGADVAVGEVITLGDHKSFLALINEGKGYAVNEAGDPVDPVLASSGAEAPGTAEDDVELTKKALDDQYKLEELKAEAKLAEVDFPYDVKKGVLIDMIMAQGKAAALLK
ncbi:hypothetical protein [Paenibacillus agilis]|uniref:Uncharacterized protein n=1 Tax=Paenibacillus agilis TaxID=3020863 RepID=A0A559IX56_9BACL|nr:hypothetical protein [Paenibacillus agilis]TVX92217.1 hypothetical protein FPZ44_03580 [Paenibacillus agilis]